MFYPLSPNLKFLKHPWYMQSADKTYARLNFLTSRQDKVKPSMLLISERNFENIFGVTSAALMEEYPLDETAKEYINASYEMSKFEHENQNLFDDEKDFERQISK